MIDFEGFILFCSIFGGIPLSDNFSEKIFAPNVYYSDIFGVEDVLVKNQSD